MPRYKLADNGLDPEEWSLIAENPEDAYVAFQKQWEDWKTRGLDEFIDDPFDTERGLALTVGDVVPIGDRRRFVGPRPTCCEQGETAADPYREQDFVIRFYVDIYPTEGEPLRAPGWKIKGFYVTHCPFCGSQLPETELLENPPEPLCRSDGDYCDTCSQRLMGCDCNWPEAAYGVKQGLTSLEK